MKHSPGFLKLVDDAKTRVKQIDIEGYKKMAAAGEKHVLVDTREDSEWANGPRGGRGASEQGNHRARHRDAISRTRRPRWCCIAAAGSVRRWWRTTCRRWDTRTRFRSMAAGGR